MTKALGQVPIAQLNLREFFTNRVGVGELHPQCLPQVVTHRNLKMKPNVRNDQLRGRGAKWQQRNRSTTASGALALQSFARIRVNSWPTRWKPTNTPRGGTRLTTTSWLRGESLSLLIQDHAGFVADADGAFDDAFFGDGAVGVEGDVPGAGGEGEVVAESVGAVGDDANVFPRFAGQGAVGVDGEHDGARVWLVVELEPRGDLFLVAETEYGMRFAQGDKIAGVRKEVLVRLLERQSISLTLSGAL